MYYKQFQETNLYQQLEKKTMNADYSFKSLPFFDETEETNISLIPDSFLDSMEDDFDDELAS